MIFRSARCLSVLCTFVLAACAATPPAHRAASVAEGTHAQLALLESTDIHSNILSYDYYKLAEEKTLGFERMAPPAKEE